MEQMQMNKVFKDSNAKLLDGINELTANVSILSLLMYIITDWRVVV